MINPCTLRTVLPSFLERHESLTVEAEGRLFCWLFSQVKTGLMFAEIGVVILIATHQCKHSYMKCVWASIMSVRQYLHIKADVCFVSYCHKLVKHWLKKSSAKRHFGQHQGLASSAFEGLENTDTLLAALDISSGSTDSLFPDETAVQWTVSACCELWVWYLIHIMHLLNLTHHCHSINRDIHVQNTVFMYILI